MRSSGSPERRIVRAHISQEDSALDLLEREANGVGGPALPNPARPLDALDAERRVRWVSFVQSQCFGESVPVLGSEFLCGPLEAGSPRCHSSVQKYACDASTRLFLRRTISSGVRTSATKTSPSDARMRRRISEGRVIWPLRRRVRTAEAFAIRKEYHKLRNSQLGDVPMWTTP